MWYIFGNTQHVGEMIYVLAHNESFVLFLHKTAISKFLPVKIELDLIPMYQNIETYASKVILDLPTPNSSLPKNINQL